MSAESRPPACTNGPHQNSGSTSRIPTTVGDKGLDVTPSLELGGVGVLVRTGYDVDESAQVPADTAVVDDLMEAARLILSRD